MNVRVLGLLLLVVSVLGCNSGLLITGRIDLFGSQPHSFVGMVKDNGEVVRLEGPLREEVGSRYQGRRVSLRVIQREAARGPGMPAVYEIRAIDAVSER